MEKYWDCEKLQKDDPNKFQSIGNQFVNRLKSNIKEIISLYSKHEFCQTYAILIEVSCQSKIVYAEQLDSSVVQLKNYLNQYLDEIEGIQRIRQNFQSEEEKQAVILFLDVIQIATSTINDWYQFNNLPQQNDVFQSEIDSIAEIYKIYQTQQNTNECECQLI
ncbi:unnamed protein product [Paramecium octaurelia]|uniref:Uncharacterized protein n=1 Tax=Paramecium octaurelia TaxID=43137 RepID=A0A8S1UTY5_PAROT|nr:unnamed protein product [Paramecium octaurelia]